MIVKQGMFFYLLILYPLSTPFHSCSHFQRTDVDLWGLEHVLMFIGGIWIFFLPLQRTGMCASLSLIIKHGLGLRVHRCGIFANKSLIFYEINPHSIWASSTGKRKKHVIVRLAHEGAVRLQHEHECELKKSICR